MIQYIRCVITMLAVSYTFGIPLGLSLHDDFDNRNLIKLTKKTS